MEDSSIQGQLAELREKVEENTRILKAMRRDALIAGIIKTVIWVGLLVISYQLTMQFLEPYMAMLQGGSGGQEQDFGALIEQYRELLGQ